MKALLKDKHSHLVFDNSYLNWEIIFLICCQFLLQQTNNVQYYRRYNVLIYGSQILLTLRRLTSYIYGAPILDVSRSHTTTQHSR